MVKDELYNSLNELLRVNPWKYVKSDNIISVRCLNFSGYVNLYGDEEYKVLVIYPGDDGYNTYCYDSSRLEAKGSDVEDKLTTFYLIAFHDGDILISYSEEGLQETVDLNDDQYNKMKTFIDTLIKGFNKYSQSPLKLAPKERELEIIKKSDDTVSISTFEYDGRYLFKDFGFSSKDKLENINILENKEYEISISAIDFALEIDGVNRPVFICLIRDLASDSIIFGKGAYYDETHNAIFLLFKELSNYIKEKGIAKTIYVSDKPTSSMLGCILGGQIKSIVKDISNEMLKDILVVNQKIRYILPKFEDNVATLDTLIWPFKGKKNLD